MVLKGSDIIITSCFREVNDELDLRELFEQHLWAPSQLSGNARVELFIKRRFKGDKIGSLTFEQLEIKNKPSIGAPKLGQKSHLGGSLWDDWAINKMGFVFAEHIRQPSCLRALPWVITPALLSIT